MRSTQVSIIIVNYNTCHLLQDCLRSIKEFTSDICYEVIVVDNHSSDDSVATIREQFGWVKLIEAGDNLGFGRANNLGFQVAEGNVFFLLNTDTLLINNAIKTLYDYLRTHPETGMCGGQILQADHTPGESFNYRWTVGREVYSVFLPKFLQRLLNPILYPATDSQPKDVDNIVGADLMIPREIVEQTGGFDPDFFMYYEESEWAFRVLQSGYKVRYVPSARIIHLQGASVNKEALLKKRVYREAWIGKFLYFYKVNGAKSPSRLLRVHRIKYKLARYLLLWDAKRMKYWKEKFDIIQESYIQAQKIIQSRSPLSV